MDITPTTQNRSKSDGSASNATNALTMKQLEQQIDALKTLLKWAIARVDTTHLSGSALTTYQDALAMVHTSRDISRAMMESIGSGEAK